MRYLGILLLFTGVLVALAQVDQNAPQDSVRADTTAVWPDTAVVTADSLAPPIHAAARHGWLYPMGIAMVTCMGFVMLFTMRSR